MRFFAVLLLLTCGCGTTVASACNDYVVAWCDRHYACYTDTALTALQQSYGQTAADCAVTKADAVHANCLGAQSTCPAGTSYDTGAAETCVSEYQNAAWTCDDVASGRDPEDCNQSKICH